MADQKISQLTAATTPLSGTEVLPVVQSGVTTKVSIANVTAGRSVGAQQVNITAAAGGGFTTPALIADDGTAAARIVFLGAPYAGVPAGKPWIHSYQDIYVGSDAGTTFNVMSGGTKTLGVDGTGNATVPGNFVVGTAGKGIDFSGSSGGFIGSKRGQITSAGGSTTTLVTLDNANENRVYLLTVRQSGGTANTVIGQVISFGGSSGALRIAQDNTLVALDMNFTTSGLDVQLVIGAGFGSTTWDWVLTRIA